MGLFSMAKGARGGVRAVEVRGGHVGSEEHRAHKILAGAGPHAALVLAPCKDPQTHQMVAAAAADSIGPPSTSAAGVPGGLRRHCVIGCADHEQNPSAVRSGSSRVRGGPGRATAPRQRPCRPGRPRADCRPGDGAPSGLPLVGLHPDQGVDRVRCLPPPGTIPLDDQQRAAGRNLDRSLPAVLVPSRRPVTDRLAVVHRDKDPVNQQVGPAEAGMLPGDVSRCG
jgi:hypothetical protein